MSSKSLADPFDMLSATKELFANQKSLLPAGDFLPRLSETFRSITQAQLAYGQDITRANATLLAAMFAPALGNNRDVTPSDESQGENERPTHAAHRRDMDAP